MQHCPNCGTSLPENAQFCAHCGHALNLSTNMPTYSDNLAYQEGIMRQSTNGSGKNEEEEERRRRILLGLPLLGATLGDAQPSVGNVPAVQGSPSSSGVPMVQGTPSMGGVPAAQSASPAPFNAPSIPGIAHPGPPLEPQVIQHPLISHPAQRPVAGSGEFHHTVSPPTRPPKTPLKHVPKHGLRSIPKLVSIPIVVIVIIGGILGTIYIILPPSLSLSGDTISGTILHLHGGNFFPGGTVVLTIDNGQKLTLVSPRGPVTVGGIGTFDANISGTENWTLGQHTIHAIENSGGRNGALSFTLNANHTKVVPNISSFSSPGDAHCTYHGNQGWVCQATISTSSHALGNLFWSVSSSGLNGITITPTNGLLTPGQAQQVTMAIPNTVCPASATFNFTFKGGEEPVSVRWSCAVPKIYWNAVNCPYNNGYDVCPVVLNVTANSEGLVHWTAFGNSPGILINPQSGTLDPGQSQPVTVAFPANPCTDTSWSVKDSAGNVFPANLSCTPVV